ncbi:MAG: hypothetical protein HZA53_04730 [Planctomycetes bacterium]|nr:hypothetical protein [Planctomycetota bacterium]
MKYFTRGWVNGELDDDASEAVVVAYRRRLEAIMPSLPESVRRLAREVSLHDALVEQVRWRPHDRTLTLVFVVTCGPGAPGTARVVYEGALLGERRLDALRSVARDRDAVLLYDEVDLGEDGGLVHRLLFWPREEVTVDCRVVHVELAPRGDCRVELSPGFLIEDPESLRGGTNR